MRASLITTQILEVSVELNRTQILILPIAQYLTHIVQDFSIVIE